MFRQVVWVAVLALTALAGCQSTPAERALSIAEQSRMVSTTLPGGLFSLAAFHRLRDGDQTLWVFLDGDGTPWTRGGTVIASDPTPREPMGLRLAAETSGSVLYVARPCHFAAPSTAGCCDPRWWTSHRYSGTVVDSIASAIVAFIEVKPQFRQVILVGYSGGGTLATLVGERNPAITEVVTIAGNLDTDAWVRFHSYLPLEGSLNPASAIRVRRDLRRIHFVGLEDENVPPRLNAAYLGAHPEDQVREFPEFGHVCCWVAEWPRLQPALAAEFEATEKR